MKTKAIRVHQTGGPEVLRFEEVELPPPGAGDVLIRQTAIGLNYIDTYHRSGLYPLPLPTGLGSEGAGIVEQVGPNVTDLAVDDRVAYASGPLGAYAEQIGRAS
ncbi:MAG: alcohol dehydrogenase catalytic domain-containing protein, partial [Vicinamibacterales bacterium]